VEGLREQVGTKGYATGFEGVVRYINEQLPSNEVLGQAFRREFRMYPEVAIRELVANALIHQDFTVTGDGPKIEIFSDRVEITNPGRPLIDTLRFVDEPPQSRNEALASLMRRMHTQLHTSFLIVTHDPRLAARCDRVLELVDGRLVHGTTAAG
jgi:predicted HTH transcriptional regulator